MEQLSARVDGAAKPAGHATHATWPERGCALPAAHAAHVVPLAPKVPAGQPTQPFRALFTVPLKPATRHDVQAVAPVRLPVWLVAVHAEQLDWPAAA